MVTKYLLLLLAAAVVTARLDNSYLPPTNNKPSTETNLPTGVESDNPNNLNGNTNSDNNSDAKAAILKFENTINPDNGYNYEYETENQIHHRESGTLKNGIMSVEGSYSYMGPDGVMYTVTYVADENGFRATGEHIPTAPPTPEGSVTAASVTGHDESPYHREHNHDTQAVIIEAQPQHEPQSTVSREYLPPPGNHPQNEAHDYL